MHLGTKKRIQTGFCTWDNTRFRRLAAISQTHYSWSWWWCNFGGKRRSLFRNGKTLDSSSSYETRV